jgi:hypothetical protein
MAMPTGDTPQKAEQYYQYLLAHHQTEHRVDTWKVDWISLAWVWGFVVVLSLLLLWWVWQYRSTRQKSGLYPVDSWSGFTSELAGPATRFFILLSVIVVGFAIALIVGHLLNGQIF